MSQWKSFLVVALFLVGLMPTATSQAAVAYSISFTNGQVYLDVSSKSENHSSIVETNYDSRFEFYGFLDENESIDYTNNNDVANNLRIISMSIKVTWEIQNWTNTNNFSMAAFGMSKTSSEQTGSMELVRYVNEVLTEGSLISNKSKSKIDFESIFFVTPPSLEMSFSFNQGTMFNLSQVSFEVSTEIVTWTFNEIVRGTGACTEMVVSNEGQATIDVDVSLSGGGVTISPDAVSVTLGPGGSITVPICALALTMSSYKTVQVSALASGRETNTQLNQVNKNAGFALIIAPYQAISVSSSPTTNICFGNTSQVNFTAVNNGNYRDTVAVEVFNQEALEEAGFTVALLAAQYQIDAAGEQPVRVMVDSTEVSNTELDYPLTLNVSTTLQGERTSAESTTIMKFVDCEADKDNSKKEQNTDSESDSDNDYEGDEAGECSDGADNDRDGLFDCDDDTCAGSSSCKNSDSIEESGLSSLSLLSVLSMLGIISILRRR